MVLIRCTRQHTYNFRIVDESQVEDNRVCFCGAPLHVVDDSESVSSVLIGLADAETAEMPAIVKSEVQ